MEYTPLWTKATSGSILNLADYDAIRFNFEVGVPDLFTAKGDLAVGKYSDGATKLPVGADGDMLTPRSTEPSGLVWDKRPFVRAYNSANIDPSVSEWVSLTFDTDRVDTHGLHSTTTGTGKITIPANRGGLYKIGGNVQFDTSGLSGAGTAYGLRIVLNDETVIAQRGPSLLYMSGNDVCMAITTVYVLAWQDSLELQAWTGSDINILAGANFSPVFWAALVRPKLVL